MTASCWSGVTGRIATSLIPRVSHTDLSGDLVRRSECPSARGVARAAACGRTADGWTVTQLLARGVGAPDGAGAPGKSEPHVLWDTARIDNGNLVYDAGTLPLPA